MDFMTNFCFEEIALGQRAELRKTLSQQDIALFSAMSGDVNPAHLDQDYASKTPFKTVIAHGMWSSSFISTLLGTILPGPGTIYLSQSLRFKRPVILGDQITVSIEVIRRDEEKKRIAFANTITNQRGEVVVIGESEVIPPTTKLHIIKPKQPMIMIEKEEGVSHGF